MPPPISIVMAPFSNDPLRDWPAGHYRDLAALCVARLGADVVLVGGRTQRAAVNGIVRPLPAMRVRNLCGRTSWRAVEALVAAAACVVANNSGIAHLAASGGVPTVCVFGASHDPLEWMPRGPRVTVLYKRTGCSPCALARAADCPFDRRCLSEISPQAVFAAVSRACGLESVASDP